MSKTKRPSAACERALAALEAPLRFAAKDGFRNIDGIARLGVTLGAAARKLADAAPRGEAGEAMAELAGKLEAFDDKARAERVRLVALGMRLVAQHGASLRRAAPAPVRRPGGRRGRAARDEQGVAPRGDGTADAEPTPATGLDAPLSTLPGVGPALAGRLAERGLERVEDLLFFLPLGYRDDRTLTPIDALEEGLELSTSGVIVNVRGGRPRGRRMVEVQLAAAEGEDVLLSCVWFGGAAGLTSRFERGQTLRVSGRVRRYRSSLQMAHPRVAAADAEGEVRPRYSEVPKVAPRVLERACRAAVLAHAGDVIDALPAAIADAFELPPLDAALHAIHLCEQSAPDAQALALLERGEHPAQRRLALGELFSLSLAVALRRERWAERASPACEREAARAACAEASSCLPFELTAAQRRVIDEICADMASERPMHRLLQGDVGAGKTAVAFSAAAAAMQRGLQVALMAPTELLAEQHHAVLAPWCQALGKRAALLSASTPRASRETLLALADAGEVSLMVGTHALLAERVQLPSLGLCIIDEQHRFGVLQRARLRERAGEGLMPHLLVMTATPIPRTMALTVYGDLDLSLLDELPPGRIPAQTHLFEGASLEAAGEPLAMVRARLAAGEQAFVVAPLVERSEALVGVADAESSAARLKKVLAPARLGLVHGRLPSDEREAVLDAFRRRELDVLVATTVIEVGLDVPGATVMVVQSAERFGLAQLHQLRGRVGRRAGARPLCLLLSGAGDIEQSRLEVLTRSTDGFVIAEADLAHRGPGELFGTRQSGVPRLRFADLQRHIALLAEAQRAARQLLADDPRLERPEHQQAREAMQRRFGEQPLPGAEAG